MMLIATLRAAAFSKRAREERERLMALDTNRDGVITRDEILRNASASSRAIDGIDTNKDQPGRARRFHPAPLLPGSRPQDRAQRDHMGAVLTGVAPTERC
jgi:hypothetical protein